MSKKPVRRGSGSRKPNDLRSKIDRAIDDAGKKPTVSKPRASRSDATKRPPLRIQTTTLWEYPSQHYDDSLGRRMQGDKRYEGATPSWVIWNLLQRYTRPGNTVLDPMCGSGTTLDVCHDLDRRGVGFDLQPTRDDITRADAREIPLDDASIDFAFVDPPYSTHINYSDDPACIGKLDAAAEAKSESEPMGAAYYEAMEEVFSEIERVLKPDRYAAVYVSDSWRKRKTKPGGVFMPIGAELFTILGDYFVPVDWVAVVRKNEKLERGNWHKAAEEENFFLRGFNHLLIMYKPRAPRGK